MAAYASEEQRIDLPEPLRFSGLDIDRGATEATHIPDPIQTILHVPSTDSFARVFASCEDDVGPGGTFAYKVAKQWLGFASRANPPPDPCDVYFSCKGVVLVGTVESCTHFFIHEDVKVHTDGHPDEFMNLRRRLRTWAKSPELIASIRMSPFCQRTLSHAKRYGKLMKKFHELDTSCQHSFKNRCLIDTKCLGILDVIDGHVIDDVDTKGLKEASGELRKPHETVNQHAGQLKSNGYCSLSARILLNAKLER